jgi:hypothetical protein
MARSAWRPDEALPGGYPNLLARGDEDRAAKSYGRNAERLIKAKRLYDPAILLRHSDARSVVGATRPRTLLMAEAISHSPA